jgi:hypothetical protein
MTLIKVNTLIKISSIINLEFVVIEVPGKYHNYTDDCIRIYKHVLEPELVS